MYALEKESLADGHSWLRCFVCEREEIEVGEN